MKKWLIFLKVELRVGKKTHEMNLEHLQGASKGNVQRKQRGHARDPH